MTMEEAGEAPRDCATCGKALYVTSQTQGAGPVPPDWHDLPYILTDTDCGSGCAPLLLHRPGVLEGAQPSLFKGVG